MRRTFLGLALACALTTGCAGTPPPSTASAETSGAATPAAPTARAAATPETRSLFGEPLYPPVLPPEVQRQREIFYEQTEMAWQVRQNSAEARLAMGRRLIDLGRIREAVEVFTQGIEAFPTSPYFLRHRAQAYLALRQFDKVGPDIERGLALLNRVPDSFEQDTLPNQRGGTPTTTMRSNFWYYLGFTRYAQGDFPGAVAAWQKTVELSPTVDVGASARLWLYLALEAAGRKAETAAVLEPARDSWDILGDRGALRVLLLIRDGGDEPALLAEARTGALEADVVEAGLGLWHLRRGERRQGVELLRAVLARGNWPSPAAIAAEAELKRLGEKPARKRSR
jgi:tetratricopeptide (TPR) repeat protein